MTFRKKTVPNLEKHPKPDQQPWYLGSPLSGHWIKYRSEKAKEAIMKDIYYETHRERERQAYSTGTVKILSNNNPNYSRNLASKIGIKLSH